MKNDISVESNFDKKSSNYDVHYNGSMNAFSLEKQTRLNFTLSFLSSLPCFDKLDILDFGCGTGILAEKLFERLNYKTYTGYDLSKKMISICRTKYIGSHEAIFSNDKNDLTSYNIVVSLGVVGYQTNHYNFLLELTSYFKKNGPKYLIITVGNQNFFRNFYDFLKSKFHSNKPVYKLTPNSDLNLVLMQKNGAILEEQYIFPFFGFMPQINNIRSLRFLYLTKYLILKFN